MPLCCRAPNVRAGPTRGRACPLGRGSTAWLALDTSRGLAPETLCLQGAQSSKHNLCRLVLHHIILRSSPSSFADYPVLIGSFFWADGGPCLWTAIPVYSTLTPPWPPWPHVPLGSCPLEPHPPPPARVIGSRASPTTHEATRILPAIITSVIIHSHPLPSIASQSIPYRAAGSCPSTGPRPRMAGFMASTVARPPPNVKLLPLLLRSVQLYTPACVTTSHKLHALRPTTVGSSAAAQPHAAGAADALPACRSLVEVQDPCHAAHHAWRTVFS